MSVVSGVISRQVLPACGSLCFFCPAMRARSRQPVKRYKKLISDIFPRSQEEEPNDRKIGKLCEYAAKNPLRIPKIANSLEQRCYKELRNENFRSVKIIMCTYRKLLVSCKEQLPLFANSVLTIMHTLLDQANKDEMLTVGCESLFDFVNNQNDGSYIFNLEGFIPKICQLSQEAGEDERSETIRAAGLQALSAMVWFMGENSHISAEFDSIVSVVLENYEGTSKESGEPNEKRWVQEVHKTEGHVSPSPDGVTKVPSWRVIVNDKGQLNVSSEEAKNPCFWSRVCLHNMAKLGKEATTMRRVLESLFRYFDNGNLWTAKHGIAFPVLKEMQLLMDDSGQNTHFLLSILVKHLDHKNVVKQPEMQLDIVEVVTGLAKLTKVQSSVAIVSAVSDIMRHLRKCIHNSLDDANLGDDLIKTNRKFRDAVDECLTELSSKVGDAGLILDVMATMLENIPNVTVIARTTISAVYRTAQIIASLPNLSYQKKAFPEALFHQLLPAMLHPDHETRIGAHQIFSVVLVPTSVSPQSDPAVLDPNKKMDFPRTLSRTVSVFSSSAALFEKLKKQRNNSKENLSELNKDKVSGDDAEQKNNMNGVLNRVRTSYSRVYSFRSAPATDAESATKDPVPLRLSSHQISILLSSIWEQSTSPTNKPENYVAIAHTYSLVLLFSRAKNSYRDALIRCFQLAFSLRAVSLASGGMLPPSRCRSLYVMSTCMIIFSSKAYDILPLVPRVKSTLSSNMVDPFLCLVEDSKLQLNENESGHQIGYGSEEDDSSAQRCLSDIKINEDHTRESLVSVIIKNLDNLSESEESTTREQLLNDFLPDELCSIKSPLYNNGPEQRCNTESHNNKSLEKAASLFVIDDDSLGSSKHISQLSIENFNLLSVDQLLQSVLDTAQHVGRMSVSTAPDVSYKETANHCETLLMGKQQKMSNLINTQQQRQQLHLLTLPSHKSVEQSKTVTKWQGENSLLDQNGFGLPMRAVNGAPTPCSAEAQQYPSSLRLPASSPYDNFLKAAGC
ncbi:protein efr3 homolog b [Phtheirospermum japonicum]|uniref:Protein efr3 homolog b n=1 Tax=Phtheirospermum japonicum TaxID=374723 RepID=A0A830C226_9LAMI|nr:protein efr3 homolog b [Phtheirospermum japonicum]